MTTTITRLSLAALLLAATAPALAESAAQQQLQERCEAARQEKIGPLQADEIEKCVRNRGTQADCERKFSGYGDATRTKSGKAIPRMFDDLPECVAARNGQQQSN